MLLKLTLELPSDVYHEYVKQSPDGDMEDVMSSRLAACVGYDADKPLYFSDAERQELEHLLGRNLSSASEALAAVKRALTVKLDGVEVPLQPALLTRLKTRCFGKTFPEFLKERIVRGLEEFTMMG